jgi:hypothetical protein
MALPKIYKLFRDQAKLANKKSLSFAKVMYVLLQNIISALRF